MATLTWIALGAVALLTVGLVVWMVRLERKSTHWAWLHPPNEDDDGVFLMEEDDPDGQNSR